MVSILLATCLASLAGGCKGNLCPAEDADRIVHSFVSDPGKGDPEVFAACLEAGANPNALFKSEHEPEGWTPLLLTAFGNANDASRQADDSIWNAASLEQVRLLLEHGADVRAKTPDGENAVYLSAVAGRVPLIELFLSKGLPVDEVTTSGKTPLFGSITYARTDVVELLLRHGANPNHIDGEGQTVLDYAMRILLAAEQSGKTSASGFEPARVIEILKNNGAKTAQELGRAH